MECIFNGSELGMIQDDPPSLQLVCRGKVHCMVFKNLECWFVKNYVIIILV